MFKSRLRGRRNRQWIRIQASEWFITKAIDWDSGQSEGSSMSYQDQEDWPVPTDSRDVVVLQRKLYVPTANTTKIDKKGSMFTVHATDVFRVSHSVMPGMRRIPVNIHFFPNFSTQYYVFLHYKKISSLPSCQGSKDGGGGGGRGRGQILSLWGLPPGQKGPKGEGFQG